MLSKKAFFFSCSASDHALAAAERIPPANGIAPLAAFRTARIGPLASLASLRRFVFWNIRLHILRSLPIISFRDRDNFWEIIYHKERWTLCGISRD